MKIEEAAIKILKKFDKKEKINEKNILKSKNLLKKKSAKNFTKLL